MEFVKVTCEVVALLGFLLFAPMVVAIPVTATLVLVELAG